MKRILVFILTVESRLIIRKYKPFIVAITGSVGKTSTKDAIYTVLKDQSFFVRKSEKSMNSEIGLPLTIIGVANAWHSLSGWINNIITGLKLIVFKSDYPDCLILEIGADHPRDIKKVVKWLHPDIAVITKVSSTPVHIEFFKSPEQVFEEKASLATAVKDGGTLVLFADDEKVMSIGDMVKGRGINIISFGLNDNAIVRGFEDEILYRHLSVDIVGQNINDGALESNRFPVGFSFKVTIDNMIGSISVDNVIGKVYTYPLLAAVAVGKARGMSLDNMTKYLSEYEAPRGRMNIISGMNGSTLIDDTYNSSPDAVESALMTLKTLDCSGSRIAILGDMMELGKYSAMEHHRIGKLASNIVSKLITVGQRSRATADEAIACGMKDSSVYHFDNSIEAGEFAKSLVKVGDIVLIKGSQSVRMERVVKVLLKEPEKADRLLVRQEKEWLDKK